MESIQSNNNLGKEMCYEKLAELWFTHGLRDNEYCPPWFSSICDNRKYSILKMKVAGSSKIILNLYQTKWLHIPEDSILLVRRYVFIAWMNIWIFIFTSMSEVAVEFDGLLDSSRGPCSASYRMAFARVQNLSKYRGNYALS
jgi:hypothetical protein